VNVTADLIISNGTVVTGGRLIRADLAIEAGRISAIGAAGRLAPGRETIDATGLHVLPGVIDAHVHFRTPGAEHKEDLTTGSLAAVFGGVTCVMDMPNTVPTTSDAAMIEVRQAGIERASYVDQMLTGVLTDANADQVEPMAAAGVVGFKAYLGESVGSIATPDDGQLLATMEWLATTGLRLAFHAENGAILTSFARRLRATGRTDGNAFAESRPVVAEVEAISRACLFARATGARIHILHLSSKDGLETIREWRARGVDVTVETAPQYLFLSEDDFPRLGARLRCNPPVRTRADGAALFDGLLDGGIDMIATDHAPHTIAEKTTPNIWDAMSGVLGVETSVQLLLSNAVHGRGMSLVDLARLTSEGPARTWGVWPRKGAILPGADADLTLIDLERAWVIDDAELHSKHKVSPWNGWRGRGLPVTTIVGGVVVVRDRQLVADGPTGRFVRPMGSTTGEPESIALATAIRGRA
jgi:dihydroorotase